MYAVPLSLLSVNGVAVRPCSDLGTDTSRLTLAFVVCIMRSSGSLTRLPDRDNITQLVLSSGPGFGRVVFEGAFRAMENAWSSWRYRSAMTEMGRAGMKLDDPSRQGTRGVLGRI